MHRLQINDTISECSTRPTNWKWFMSPLKTSLLTFSQSRLLDSALNWTDQELECGKYHVICFKIDQRWSPHFSCLSLYLLPFKGKHTLFVSLIPLLLCVRIEGKCCLSILLRTEFPPWESYEVHTLLFFRPFGRERRRCSSSCSFLTLSSSFLKVMIHILTK